MSLTAEIYYALFWFQQSVFIPTRIISAIVARLVCCRWLARIVQKYLEFATSGPWLSQENKTEKKSENDKHSILSI